MSLLQELIDQLTDAKNKLAASERAATQAATDLQRAENLVKEALDGADDLSVVNRMAEKRMWVLAGLGGVALLKTEIDAIIQRVYAAGIGNGSNVDSDLRGRAETGNEPSFVPYGAFSASPVPDSGS